MCLNSYGPGPTTSLPSTPRPAVLPAASARVGDDIASAMNQRGEAWQHSYQDPKYGLPYAAIAVTVILSAPTMPVQTWPECGECPASLAAFTRYQAESTLWSQTTCPSSARPDRCPHLGETKPGGYLHGSGEGSENAMRHSERWVQRGLAAGAGASGFEVEANELTTGSPS